MATERRTPTRVRVKWPVVIITGRGVVVAETRDISNEGAFISCDLPLSPNEKLRLFIMAPNHRPFEIPAEVAWSTPQSSKPESMPSGMGVRFTETSAPQHQLLRNMVEQLYKAKLNSTK
jgi:Tfp pilus assembly protein PilZ